MIIHNNKYFFGKNKHFILNSHDFQSKIPIIFNLHHIGTLIFRKPCPTLNISRDPQCRFSVCRKALSDFKKLAPSTETLAEAIVYYVERVCEFSFYAGDLWEQYYDSAVSNFRSMLKFLVKNNMLEAMMPRVVQIMAWCWPCGYGFHDEIGDSFCELVPPQYHSKVNEADALGKAQYYAIHPDLKH